ncbi:MAG: ImmA/IrrE family metallo-endopeptidase [Selenomonadaceae bacterium]|nr:ImmA/IrrE family metallo-endopeptidase [Selenomonadaceae bacterium]
MDVKQKVLRLIRRYHTDDPLRLADALGIHVIYGDLGGVRYGNYMRYKREKFIFLDTNTTPPGLLTYVAAHELGHAVCTPTANTTWLRSYTMSVNADIVERKANTFAVELLLNDYYLKEYADCGLEILGATKGVPLEMLALKRV